MHNYRSTEGGGVISNKNFPRFAIFTLASLILVALLEPDAAYGQNRIPWRNETVEKIEQEKDAEKRLKLINAFLSTHPNEVEAYGLRSIIDNSNGQYKTAVDDANVYLNRKDLNKRPPDFDIRVLKIRAHAYYASERCEQAMKDISRYEQMAPKDSDIYFIEGIVRKRLGQKAEAQKAFKVGCSLGEPRSCAELIKEACEYDDAQTLNKLVNAYVQSHKPLNCLKEIGETILNENNFAHASNFYRTLVTAAPEDQDFRQKLIHSLIKQNREAEAFAEIDKTTKSAEEKERQKVAFIFMRQDIPRSFSAARNAAQKFPDCPDFIVYQADCLIRQKHYKEALTLISEKKKFAMNPAFAPLKAEANYRLQDFLPAAENWAIANKAAPTAYGLEQEATSLALLHRYEPAVACFSKALAMKPGAVRLIGQRADALLHLRRYDEAIADFSTLLKIESEKNTVTPVNHYGRGLCYVGKHDYKAAQQDFTFVIQHDQNLARPALISRAECFEKLGDLEGAKRDRLRAAEFDKKLEKDLF